MRGYFQEKDVESKELILENFMYSKMSLALEFAKDEITACLRDTAISKLQPLLRKFFFEQNNGPYDYLSGLRKWKEMENDSLYQEAVRKILIKEYTEIIEKAIESLLNLIQKRDYSIEQVIALLTDKSLVEWPKTIKRLLE